MSDALDVLKWVAVFGLVCCSALFAGLTLGMLSLDKVELEVVAAGEDVELAACARRLIPLRQNGNLLLCTFLIGNTACNSLSAILMADIAGGLAGFLISTFAILLFGEIIPQAACSRYALQIGVRVVWLVIFFRAVFYPLAKPISMVLDWALGEELGTIHTRQELSKLLQIHVTRGAIDKESGAILQGALHALNVMRVSELITPVEEVYMLHISAVLDFQTIGQVFENGYSRIPVYETDRNDIVAILFAKDLILVDPDDETSLRYFISIFGRRVISFDSEVKVRVAFVKLRQGHGHLGIVKSGSVVIGVISLEDIVEEIIQEQIADETDHASTSILQDGHHKRRPTTRSKFGLLNSEIRDSVLSVAEVEALGTHLMRNIAPIREAGLDQSSIEWALQRSVVSQVEDSAVCIFEAGKSADFCVIVLTGRLELTDDNGHVTDAGSLSVVAPEALFGPYVCAFTAKIASEKARIVTVKRTTIEAAKRAVSHQTNELPATTDPNLRHAFALQLFHSRNSVARRVSEPSNSEWTKRDVDGYQSN